MVIYIHIMYAVYTRMHCSIIYCSVSNVLILVKATVTQLYVDRVYCVHAYMHTCALVVNCQLV